MRDTELSTPESRMLRLATAAEVVFLVISAFFLFTEHRAHYLGALPYALLVVAFTVFLWFVAEHRRDRVAVDRGGKSKPRKGGDSRA